MNLCQSYVTSALAITVLLLSGIPAMAQEPFEKKGKEWTQVNQHIDENDETTIAIQGPTSERRRPPFFINGMIHSGLLMEDGSNRLTSRDDGELPGTGLVLRAGGVIKENHLLGGLFQGFWRPTKDVLDLSGDDRESGMVSTYYFGPEYRYQTDFGLYFGASIGLGLVVADNSLENNKDEPSCDTFNCTQDYLKRSSDHLALSLGLVGTIGWEFRPTKNLALNIEGFVNSMYGLDEDERSMDTTMVGFAVGIGI